TATKGYAFVVPSSGSCVSAYIGAATSSLQYLGDPPAIGTCVGSQAAPSFPAATWGTDVRACGPAGPVTRGAGCPVGQCLPKPAAPFGATLCVFKAGLNSCPGGYDANPPSVYYQTVQEGRSCSQCNCGQLSCGGTVNLYSDQFCTTDTTPVAFD